VIEFIYADGNTNIVFKIAYSMHMYLFMFVSGYLASLSLTKDMNWIIKKAKSLIIPWVIWCVFFAIINRSLGNLFLNMLNGSLWFFIVLFLCHLQYWLSLKFKNKYVGLCLTFVGISGILFFIPNHYLSKMFIIHAPFYNLAIIYNCISSKLKENIKKWLWICYMLYPIFMIFYAYPNYNYYIDNIYNIFSINKTFIKLFLEVNCHIIVPILAIGMIFDLSSRIKNFKVFNLISIIGMSTMEIYILGSLFQKQWINSSNILSMIISIVLGILIPYIISQILKKLKLRKINKLLFGK